MSVPRLPETQMANLLQELSWRHLLQDQTPGLAARLEQGPVTAYVGFDPTAPSLQVGNLVPIMLLAHLQRAGGRPLVVLGGGTGLIGDPSGKQQERPLLHPRVLAANLERQAGQFRRLLPGAAILNNADWLQGLSLVDFLREVGKHFTVSVMLQKESVKARLDEGISFTEFSYMLLQAYDFWHLYRDPDWRCELQMGGSDQWGNITAGIALIRRREGGEAHGLSGPLVTTASGAKFGKSEGQAVWLDPALTAPATFYNFWVNTDDRDVERYLAMFTFKTAPEIADLMARHADDPGARVPHRALARELTARVHGEAVAEEAHQALREVFSGLAEADPIAVIERLAGQLPERSYRWDAANPPKVEDLFVAAGLATSKSNARRLLAGRGLWLNGRLPKPGEVVDRSEVKETALGLYVLLQKGKKTFQPLRIIGLE
jgi:tyrosyl-tRNA synthetase